LFAFLVCYEEKTFVVSDRGKSLIQETPSQDLEEIKILFKVLFKENEFGFTLFGDKPISFC
jgi:hypothetical protein